MTATDINNILISSDGNLVEGDTIQLEDGTTAYIQQVTVQQKGQCTPSEQHVCRRVCE